MTIKDFLRITIKLFGIYWIVSNMYVYLPFLFSGIFNFSDLKFLPYTIGYILTCILIFVFLVFYTDKIIHLVKLDKGFDEERIDFSNFNTENIIKIALIIVGCMLIINNLPTFIIQFYYFIKVHMDANIPDSFGYTNQDNFKWAISAINLILGYIILTNYSGIINFVLKNKEKKKEIEE